MNPIEILVKWRIDNLERELNIDINKIGGFIDKISEWKKIGTNLVFFKYITSNKSEDIWYYYAVMKNIIWKNIINYEIKYYTQYQIKCLYSHMLYNNYKKTMRIPNDIFYLPYESLLNKNDDLSLLQNNLHIMQLRIIKYLALINKIVTDKLILDLANTIKWYMLDLILIR